jgi:ParB family chromosome partitioning protein
MSSAKNIHRLLGLRLEADAAPAGAATGVTPMSSARIIAVDRIVPDPSQPRREFDADELRHLAGSLRDHSQTDPVKVRWDAAQDRYVLIDGERRWRAAQQIGLTTLAAVVDNRDLSADRVLELQIIENALRQDLTTQEAGEAYRTLMSSWGCTQQELADRLHISQSKVSRALDALKLPPAVQAAVQQGKVGAVAAVKKAASSQPRRRKATSKPAPVRISTSAGVVVVTPKPGRSVMDALSAAMDDQRQRDAA